MLRATFKIRILCNQMQLRACMLANKTLSDSVVEMHFKLDYFVLCSVLQTLNTFVLIEIILFSLADKRRWPQDTWNWSREETKWKCCCETETGDMSIDAIHQEQTKTLVDLKPKTSSKKHKKWINTWNFNWPYSTHHIQNSSIISCSFRNNNLSLWNGDSIGVCIFLSTTQIVVWYDIEFWMPFYSNFWRESWSQYWGG